jgi:two-component system response regulator RegA
MPDNGHAEDRPSVPPDAAAPRRTLIVDDDRVLRERLARALRDRGHEAITACDFDEAMALAVSHRPERAVVDLRMPGRSGLELVRELLAADASIQIIVLTG